MNIKIAIISFLCTMLLNVSAQTVPVITHGTSNMPRVVEVPFDKTVTLIFPSKIVENIVGNESVNISAKDHRYFLSSVEKTGFKETSLYIEIESGQYYDLVLRFNNTIKNAVTVFTVADATGMARTTSKILNNNESSLSTSDIEDYHNYELSNPEIIKTAKIVMEKGVNVSRKAQAIRKFQFYLENIYVSGDNLFMKISCYNESNIAYSIHSLDFFISPKEGLLKKTTPEPIAIMPVYILNNDVKVVDRKSKVSKVFVFKKFTLSDEKKLLIKIFEQAPGDRELSFFVEGLDLLNAKHIN